MPKCALKQLDTADIVREAILRQLTRILVRPSNEQANYEQRNGRQLHKAHQPFRRTTDSGYDAENHGERSGQE